MKSVSLHVQRISFLQPGKNLPRSECGCGIDDIGVEDIFHTKEGWLPVH